MTRRSCTPSFSSQARGCLALCLCLLLDTAIRRQVPEHQLQKAIGRWFFFSSLKGRYTSSPESTMDADLNLLREIKDAPGFLNKLDGILASEQTNDFWTISLPAKLDSSSARNRELFCYVAAQNRLAAPVLFSHKMIAAYALFLFVCQRCLGSELGDEIINQLAARFPR